ncbi:hypothetical protein ES703_47200 [subsurface metagenome]
MTAIEILSIAGVVIVAIGLIVTWVRNGRSQSKRNGVIEERINGINKRLDDENTGLGAIKSSVDKQEVNCAKITSSFKERIKNLEGD